MRTDGDCKFSGCDAPRARRGRCDAHARCSVVGCEAEAETRNLCGRHYFRAMRYGDPLAYPRTRTPTRILPTGITSPTALARTLGVTRQRAHQLLHPQRDKARDAVARALAVGALTKPAACERCDKTTTKLEAHHWDYREELDVRWLCVSCHNIVHDHRPYALIGRTAVPA